MGNGDDNGNGKGNGTGLNGRKITRHHILPRARGGAEKEDNISRIPERYHIAWHTFFGNLTPDEAKAFMDIIFSKHGRKRNGGWTVEDLYDLQLDIQKKTERSKKQGTH